MSSDERQEAIWDIILQRKFETVPNIADELGVCTRTIYGDVTKMRKKYPIEPISGKYGGVYLVHKPHNAAMHLTPLQEITLQECRKGKSVYRSALRLSDKLHWPTVSAFCSTLAANRICRTTCNIGWQKQKVCCAFFSWMCRRASCTLSFPQTANSHSARPATAYRSYSAAPCGIPVSQPF